MRGPTNKWSIIVTDGKLERVFTVNTHGLDMDVDMAALSQAIHNWPTRGQTLWVVRKSIA